MNTIYIHIREPIYLGAILIVRALRVFVLGGSDWIGAVEARILEYDSSQVQWHPQGLNDLHKCSIVSQLWRSRSHH